MSCTVGFLSSLILLRIRENRTILSILVFLMNNCSFSRLITKYDYVLLQFTTARLITIYDNLLLQFTIAWLLQFSTTVITIYDRYYNLRRLLLKFTTSITIHDIITILDRTHHQQCI